MKKKFALLATAALLIYSTTFANPKNDPAPEKIKQEFKKEFVRATGANWEAKAGFYKVSFAIDGQQLEAFYSLTSEFLGMSRNIAFSQLPLLLQKDVREAHPGYWISNLFESVTPEGTAYYLTLENANGQVTLRSDASGWSSYKTQ